MARKKSRFQRCVEAVARRGSAADPAAVCGAMRKRGTLPHGNPQSKLTGERIGYGSNTRDYAQAKRTAKRAKSEGYRGVRIDKYGDLYEVSVMEKVLSNARIPNGRMVPARIRHNGRTYPGKVKRVNGKVKIFVTPQVARQINPRANLTQKYWSIQGRYGRSWEEVTAEEWKHGVDSGRKEAVKRLREYRENEPGTAFRLVLKREKIA